MENKRRKSLAPPSLTLVAKGSRPKGKRPFRGKTGQERSACSSKHGLGKGIAKKQKTKGNGDKSIVRVKYYNCGKKGHYARDCPEPNKVPFSTKIPNKNVCSHAFVANSLPQRIKDVRANKHIVQDKAGLVDFHRYLVGSRTVVLRNGSEEDVL